MGSCHSWLLLSSSPVTTSSQRGPPRRGDGVLAVSSLLLARSTASSSSSSSLLFGIRFRLRRRRPSSSSLSSSSSSSQEERPQVDSTTTPSSSPSSSSSSSSCSWSLIVLGDLHMEDDMSEHEQCRQDCINVIRHMKSRSSTTTPSTSGMLDVEVDDQHNMMIKSLEQCKVCDLSIEQLRMLIMYREQQQQLSSSSSSIATTTKKNIQDNNNQHHNTNTYLVSLGDLGRKDIRHEPGDAGTTKSFIDAKQYLDGFNLPYNLVTGNHDLEGLDEFSTDYDNLQAWLQCFENTRINNTLLDDEEGHNHHGSSIATIDDDGPQFIRQINDNTILIGLSTIRFRQSPYSSHEVYIDDRQLDWFEDIVKSHPSIDGWTIIVFTHAPIMGSGLRVLQNVHVMNGCAWCNHCDENSRKRFISIVQDNPQIKLWFSGHFHLSHDYEDSICTIGSCTFIQVGVMGFASTRDGRRQTRYIQGSKDHIKIYTINHHLRNTAAAAVASSTDGNKVDDILRLDANINLLTGHVEHIRAGQDVDRDDWFQAYVPRQEDGCYIESPDGSVTDALDLDDENNNKVCWWHMSDGKVLGLHQGQLVEYDAETLSPLGIVMNSKTLDNRDIIVIDNGKAIMLVDDRENSDNNNDSNIEVIHPNDDGSYWRKFQRNKKIRLEEKQREAIAKEWLLLKSQQRRNKQQQKQE